MRSHNVVAGIITDEQLIVSSFYGENTAVMARGNSHGGWKPSPDDRNPWIRIDLRKVMNNHLELSITVDSQQSDPDSPLPPQLITIHKSTPNKYPCSVVAG
jgi:hypothetical protein